MHYDQELKVGDTTVTVAGQNRSPGKSQPKGETQAKVVEPPEKKAPRKSSGVQHK